MPAHVLLKPPFAPSQSILQNNSTQTTPHKKIHCTFVTLPLESFHQIDLIFHQGTILYCYLHNTQPFPEANQQFNTTLLHISIPMTTSTPEQVTYPIADDMHGGSIYLIGSPSASNIALMSAGFPDDHECFMPFATKFAEQNDALVGVTCLPGFHDSTEKPWREYRKNGYTFDEMVNAFREATKILESRNIYEKTTGEKPRLIGIFHDWGVVPGTMFINRYRQEYPDRKVEMVKFDALGPPHPEMETDLIPKIAPSSLYEIYICLGYRFIFALIHLAQRYLPEKLANDVYTIRPLRMMYMAYLYVILFKAMFTGKSQKLFQDFSLPKDFGKTPVLYMYGTDKRIMLHDYRSVQILKSSKGKSTAISVEDAGHWLYTEGQKMEYCLEKVKEFLDTV
ncbi:hypothetical protein CTEN210_02624 [Chaetoceros tenuissimus]|uniref:Uncharacterized protein n=1 Tax=Chaetoceros tenuissimus TaxID=426638 RepID=A0AAD3CJB2_9STRA|nr:hypothetical protein CTEN210_02624 [Chaetoceros tenuissimus]